MIKINDILEVINENFKTHYFKDITTYAVSELVSRKGADKKFPAIYEGNGSYNFIQTDTSGLVVYHRIEDFNNEEDLGGGFGRNSLTTEKYQIKTVFFGSQNAVDKSCKNINFNLGMEFKKLIPRRVNIANRNSIKVTGVKFDKEEIKGQEFIEYNPESILFVIEMEISIKGVEECTELSCSPSDFVECKPATITDSDGTSIVEVASGGEFSCTPIAPCEDATVENSNASYSETVASGGILALPNINFTDSDGTVSSVPSVKDLVCQQVTPKSGIAYQRPLQTYLTVSQALYDDAWQYANGTYEYTPPPNPLYTANLDDFLTLKDDNIFGNKFRFTDENGLQIFGNDYTIDHFTGLGYKIGFIGYDTWVNQLNAAHNYTNLGFTDFRTTNINEFINVANFSLLANQRTIFNYFPFNSIANSVIGISTHTWDSGRHFIGYAYYGQTSRTGFASSSYGAIYVRNHY